MVSASSRDARRVSIVEETAGHLLGVSEQMVNAAILTKEDPCDTDVRCRTSSARCHRAALFLSSTRFVSGRLLFSLGRNKISIFVHCIDCPNFVQFLVARVRICGLFSHETLCLSSMVLVISEEHPIG